MVLISGNLVGTFFKVLGLKEGRLVMRRTEGIREWQRGLQRLSGGDYGGGIGDGDGDGDIDDS